MSTEVKRNIKMRHEFWIQIEQVFHDGYKNIIVNGWLLDDRIHSS